MTREDFGGRRQLATKMRFELAINKSDWQAEIMGEF